MSAPTMAESIAIPVWVSVPLGVIVTVGLLTLMLWDKHDGIRELIESAKDWWADRRE